MAVKIYLADDLTGKDIVHYTLQLIAFNKGVQFNYTASRADADLVVDASLESDIRLEDSFYEKLTSAHSPGTRPETIIPYLSLQTAGRRDYISPIFYLVNCIQEYQTQEVDQYGRFPYTHSLQKKEGLIQQNLVQQLIDEFWARHPKLSRIKTFKRRSSFFLTHDIDTVYGAKNQNGDHALKTKNYHRIPKLLWNHYAGRPDWINMDRIMDIEEAYGFSSTFYWLVHKDKENADYDINKKRIRNQIAHIAQKGFGTGLHKSLRKTSFEEEIKRLNSPVKGQRYHFLKFNLPNAWQELEDAGIRLDTSLGFSEDFGFRNSYGLPFMPYNIKERRVYDLIEVPMTIMDRTFFNQNKPVPQIEKELIDWLDKNKENTVITVNFHNNFFDKMLYAGYDKLYMSLLSYFKEEGLKCGTEDSLIQEYYRPEMYTFA